jgi:hypothetical protein
MEVPLTITGTSLRSRALIAVLLACVLGVLALIAFGGSAPAPAAENASNRLCKGHIEKGDVDPDDPTSTQVTYFLACSGPITGYSLLPDHQVTGFDTEVFATDKATKQVVAADAFGCTGDVPGFGVNCNGTYLGDWAVFKSTFSQNEKLCDEPRVDPLVVVAYASKNAAGDVVQAMAGPFDLGRPRGCPKSALGGKRRIPKETDQVIG